MKLKPISIAVAYFIAVIVLAHFFVPPLYDWTQNTVNDLMRRGTSTSGSCKLASSALVCC
ncbi:MAG: hypothetical protein IPN96_04410 [Anaerolineales bacterium]|nr:hypothetical protein [Anaerolineales bacterium]